ncbi:3'(2'),5'-bisphosphate nucleotidase CysQ [Sphingomonas lacunae]|uniref:3'(2'),5'-bisphosphate nucleotidase CysQ n=1 Tax=Sphingomonas lacunae TaxID=2698828 RepID=UPI001FE268BC|nr:3'(2'),5'-bisphosphate nucleotidase CysQ [Sphingomonas lacunae]
MTDRGVPDPAIPTEAIISAAREVGDAALGQWRHLRGGGDLDQWSKADQSLVCEVDIETDRRLKAMLGAIDPEAGWLSEETADRSDRLARDRIWCVDPIDGTRDFLRGREGWAVSIALIDRGAPVFGVLYAPARDELWMAQSGRGASRNGAPVQAGDRAILTGARVPAAQLPKVDMDLTMVHQPNSIALRMAMVAADEADLVATLRWGFEWDIAAAALIVHEAGARVTDAFGQHLRFNTPRAQAFGVIASTPGIHGAVVDRLSERARSLAG